jgi:hypothetical protein
MALSADGWASGENITPKRGQSYPDERSEAKSNYPINVAERTYEYVHPEWTISHGWIPFRTKRRICISARVVNQLNQTHALASSSFAFIF